MKLLNTKEVYNLIYSFLEDKNILNDSNFLGVYFYGSYQNGTANDDSDIDIIIVYKKLLKQVRCIYNYKNICNIEYFKRDINSLYKRVDTSFKKRVDDVLSIIGFSTIMFNKNNELEKLKEYTLKTFKKNYEEVGCDKIMYILFDSFNCINFLKKLYNENDLYYNVYYGIVVDKLRKYYQYIIGSSRVSTKKVYKVFNDKFLKDAQHRIIPDDNFIKAFNLSVNGSKMEDKLKGIDEMYNLLLIKSGFLITDKQIFINKEIYLDGKEF
ncbi:MAG: nucleotidyltransferase domain-containing protein [Bacilli bacterium]